jgi:hypothetical protein
LSKPDKNGVMVFKQPKKICTIRINAKKYEPAGQKSTGRKRKGLVNDVSNEHASLHTHPDAGDDAGNFGDDPGDVGDPGDAGDAGKRRSQRRTP